ncbi:hypothetical protein ACLKA6_007333 [Drosophila palustris]
MKHCQPVYPGICLKWSSSHHNGTNEKILHMDRMGSQNIVVEKKKRIKILSSVIAARHLGNQKLLPPPICLPQMF